jgi:alcohol dehydrogenase
MLGMIAAGKLSLKKLIGRKISLDDAGPALASLDSFADKGIIVIDRFTA